MSDSANSAALPSWQAPLVTLEAQSLEIWRLGKEKVKQVQAKRETARAAAAHLAETERRLAAWEGESKENDRLLVLRQAVQEAKESQQRSLAEYEDALKVFHKQRTRLQQESEAIAKRREAIASALPTPVRRAYGALLGAGVPDPLAALHDGRCAACGHEIADEDVSESPVFVCPFCKRLLVQSGH
jgi:predicted  nucleic acid-binding Zn-ribbon protein